jgi:hypothetical protein
MGIFAMLAAKKGGANDLARGMPRERRREVKLSAAV